MILVATTACTSAAVSKHIGSSNVETAFTEYALSVAGVLSVDTRAKSEGPLEPRTSVSFDVTLSDEWVPTEVDATARLITEWIRTRVDDRAEVTAYVTLLAGGNAVSLSTNDASNWSRIQIVDRVVASSAVDGAWIRAPWIGDPRNSDNNGANLELVSSLSPQSLSSDAFEASVQAYLAFLPAASSAVTVIDSALDEYSSGFEAKHRSLTSFIADLPSAATLQCVNDVTADTDVMGYDFTFAGEFGSSTVELRAVNADSSQSRLESLPCLLEMQAVGFTVDGR